MLFRSRAEVRAAAGPEVEALVLRYTQLPWTAEALRAGPELDRRVLVMRLANELEDLVDLAGAYSRKTSIGAAAVALATALELPALAEALARAARDGETARLPADLVSDRRSSFTVAPAGWRPRIELRVARRLARLLGRR